MECQYIKQNNTNCKHKATQELLNPITNILSNYCTRHYNIILATNLTRKHNKKDLINIIDEYDNIIVYNNEEQNCIIKYQDITESKNTLQYEYLLLTKIFSNHENIIKYTNYQIKKNDKVTLKLESVPISFEEIKTFNLTDCQIKNIGIQLIKVIKYIHSKKYLYINLVPSNIRFKIENKHIIVKLINFDSCIKYINNDSQFYTNNKLLERQGNDFYSSRNINLGYRGVRLDDIENILYILLDLIDDNNFNKIKNLKQISRIIKKKNEILEINNNYQYNYINNYINEINKLIKYSDINKELSNKSINYNNFLRCFV